MKLKNEALKASTYSEFWRQTTKTHHRLLSAFDAEKGQFQMAFMEPLVPAPKSVKYYKSSIFSIDTKKIHEINHTGIDIFITHQLIHDYF